MSFVIGMIQVFIVVLVAIFVLVFMYAVGLLIVNGIQIVGEKINGKKEKDK